MSEALIADIAGFRIRAGETALGRTTVERRPVQISDLCAIPRSPLGKRITGLELMALAFENGLDNVTIERKQASNERIALVERTQRSRCAQRPQSLVENLILTTSLRRPSTAGVQLMLVRPAGQVACRCAQSMVNRAASNPVPARAC